MIQRLFVIVLALVTGATCGHAPASRPAAPPTPSRDQSTLPLAASAPAIPLQLLHTLEGHTSHISAIVFSPDGKILTTPSAALADLPLKVELRSTQEAYVIGEPIALRLTLTNTSDLAFKVTLEYPDVLGLRFTCNGAGVTDRATSSPSLIGRVAEVEFAPKTGHSYVLALNRYLTFSKAGEYDVRYAADYLSTGANFDKVATAASEGQFHLRILNGAPDYEGLAKVYGRMSASATEQDAEEGAEMMLWLDYPGVIAPLVDTALKMPKFQADAISSIARWSRDDRGQAAIMKLATEAQGWEPAYAEALKVLADVNARLVGQLVQHGLRSGDVRKEYQAAQYLAQHGTQADIEALESLAKSKEAAIRATAADAIAAIKAQARGPASAAQESSSPKR